MLGKAICDVVAAPEPPDVVRGRKKVIDGGRLPAMTQMCRAHKMRSLRQEAVAYTDETQ
jgi:hypothetical protein